MSRETRKQFSKKTLPQRPLGNKDMLSLLNAAVEVLYIIASPFMNCCDLAVNAAVMHLLLYPDVRLINS